MKLHRKPPFFISAFQIGAVCLGAVFSILLWLNNIQFSPDSTNYISASQNLIRYGTFFVNANWTSRTMEPDIEPYTDYPPGFPLYLSFFLLIFHDPILSVAIAQSVAILLLYLVIYLTTKILQFDVWLSSAFYLTFTFFYTFIHIYGYFWTETLFIATSLGAALCAVRLIERPHSSHWLVFGGFVLLLASSLLKIIGLFNVIWFLPLCALKRSRRYLLAAGAVAAATLPILGWFIRNLLHYGYSSRSHETLQVIHWGALMTPFHFLYTTFFDIRLIPRPLVLIGGLLVALFPLYARRFRSTSLKWVQLVYVGGFLTHFFGIWSISLVASFDQLDNRLLSPAIAIAFILLFHGWHCVMRSAGRGYQSMILRSIPFILLLLSTQTIKSQLFSRPFIIRQYPEQALWKEVRQHIADEQSSHFYTNSYAYKHQIFSEIPQKFIRDTSQLSSPEFIKALLQKGHHPFFLYSQEAPEVSVLERCAVSHQCQLRKKVYASYGYVLYYSEEPRIIRTEIENSALQERRSVATARK